MNTEQIIIYILAPVAGYLVSSIPFALVIGKAHGVDIRTTGSKNVGATNLGRTLGKKYFWQAFFLDALKGFLPVLTAALLVRHWNGNPDMRPPQGPAFPTWSPLLTAVACLLGHTYSVWLKFKGGKGVATSFGAVLGFWPLYTLAGLGGGLVFVVVLMVYRYISLASIVSAVAFVVLVPALGCWRNPYLDTYTPWNHLCPLVAVTLVFAGLIIWRHRGNIVRLIKGTEPKVGQRQRDKANFK